MSKNQNKSLAIQEFSVFHWISIFFISIFVLFFQYNRALFNSFTYDFELPIYEAMLFFFSISLLAVVHLARVWNTSSLQVALSVYILLIPFVYWLSSFQAVATHNAQLMTFINVMYSLLFILGLYLATTQASVRVFEYILYISGYSVVVYGLINMFGQIYNSDALWFTSGDYRLASIFQYSNTYAGYLLALFLCALYGATNSKRRSEAVIHAFMLVPIFISFMLTYSRGALVFVPLLMFIILLLLRLERQITYLVGLILTLGVSFAILGFITRRYIAIAQLVQPKQQGAAGTTISLWDPLAIQGWAVLMASSVILAFLIYLMNKRFDWLSGIVAKWRDRRFSFFYVPGTLVIGTIGIGLALLSGIASSILPSSIATRLANINFQQHSVLERQTFYVDAMKVVSDYPLLGAGGGAWSALYENYQNNPYISRQAHSYFIQTLVEVGWIGFIVLVALLAFIFFIYLRSYWSRRQEQPQHFIFFIFALAILAHSTIDFDLSYVYLGSILFLYLGVMSAIYRQEIKIRNWTIITQSKWRLLYPGLFAVLALTMLFQVSQEFAGYHQYRKAVDMAVRGENTLDRLIPELDKAIASSPTHPAYQHMKADWLSQAYRQTGNQEYASQAQAVLAAIKPADSYNRLIILAEYRNHKDLQEYNEMIASLEEGITKFQWDINFYEAAIMEYAVQGQSVEPSDPAAAENYWRRGLELYGIVLDRMQQLENLPEEQLQGRAFEITPFIRQAVGQIHYGMEQYQDAISILQPLTGSDLGDLYNRIGIRYYLASLKAIGQNDTNLEQLLISSDQNERMYLDSLYQTSDN